MPEYKEVEWDKRTGKGYEVSVSPTGATYYTLDGKKHREDGPAVIWRDGNKSWYLNGKLHREDGPAFIHPNGYEEWYLNGKLHREDGPAFIHPDGRKMWWLNDKELCKEDFTIEMILKMNASELFTPQELAKMRFDKGV